MSKTLSAALVIVGALAASCGRAPPTSDDIQAGRQEKQTEEAVRQVGIPATPNWREMRLLKLIVEMRDQEIPTYTYLYNEMTGKLVFFGDTIGYGIPYATQFTAPTKVVVKSAISGHYELVTVPQAEPNGLFSPDAAEGTWILMKDPNGKDTKPVYVEPRIIVSPFKLKLD
jgi:hypothetical protein